MVETAMEEYESKIIIRLLTEEYREQSLRGCSSNYCMVGQHKRRNYFYGLNQRLPFHDQIISSAAIPEKEARK